MNASEIFIFFLANLFPKSLFFVIYGFSGDQTNKGLRYLFLICWGLFTVLVEYQTSDTFPLFTIIFGLGYLLAYFALKEE